MTQCPGWQGRALALAIVLPMLGTVPAAAQEPGAGAGLFARYCATCHGLTGVGDGPMAPALILQPTDLTRLSERNGGVFPTWRVVSRIDGSDPLVAHGSPMPVYGDFFEGDAMVPLQAESGQPILTSGPIADLVAWLEAVQQ
jgi:mono/diheme cytochrome c family protein